MSIVPVTRTSILNFETLAAQTLRSHESLVAEHRREVKLLREETRNLRQQVVLLNAANEELTSRLTSGRFLKEEPIEEVDEDESIPTENVAAAVTTAEASNIFSTWFFQKSSPVPVANDERNSGIPVMRMSGARWSISEGNAKAASRSSRLSITEDDPKAAMDDEAEADRQSRAISSVTSAMEKSNQALALKMKARARALVAAKEPSPASEIQPSRLSASSIPAEEQEQGCRSELDCQQRNDTSTSEFESPPKRTRSMSEYGSQYGRDRSTLKSTTNSQQKSTRSNSQHRSTRSTLEQDSQFRGTISWSIPRSSALSLTSDQVVEGERFDQRDSQVSNFQQRDTRSMRDASFAEASSGTFEGAPRRRTAVSASCAGAAAMMAKREHARRDRAARSVNFDADKDRDGSERLASTTSGRQRSRSDSRRQHCSSSFDLDDDGFARVNSTASIHGRSLSQVLASAQELNEDWKVDRRASCTSRESEISYQVTASAPLDGEAPRRSSVIDIDEQPEHRSVQINEYGSEQTSEDSFFASQHEDFKSDEGSIYTTDDHFTARLKEAWNAEIDPDAILNFMLPKRRKSVQRVSAVVRRSAQYHQALSRTSGVNMFTRSGEMGQMASRSARPQKQTFFLVLHPQSPARVLWDFTSMLFIGYDLVMIPLEVFELPDSVLWEVMSLVFAVFWSMDMCLSMITGVYIKGELEMSLRHIMKRYAMTWMFIDIVLISFEWIAYFGGGVMGVAGTTRSARVMRLFRTLRVTRVVKLLPVFSKIEDSIISSSLLLVFKILKLLFGLVLINHVIACFWFAVGDSSDDGWTRKEMWEKEDTNYLYLTSLHWAITQFHGTMQSVEPGTVGERMFAVGVLLIALIVCSGFISSVTSLMLQIQAMQQSSNNLKQQMRQFLEDKVVISTRLAVRMKKYIEGKGLAKIMQEREDQFLSIFPETLLMDLHAQLRAPKLTLHPFFAGYGAQYPRVMVKVCHEAVKEMDLVSGDVIFHDGDVAEEMYVVAGGLLRYTLFSAGSTVRGMEADSLHSIMVMHKLSSTRTSSTSLDEMESQDVKREEWVSEAALWVQWEHLGELTASVNTTLLSVEYEKFSRVVQYQEEAHTDAVIYARMFRQLLNTETWSDILPVPLQTDNQAHAMNASI